MKLHKNTLERALGISLWVLVNLIIIVLSLLPSQVVGSVVISNDKISHFLAYCALGFLTFTAFHLWLAKRVKGSGVLVLLTLIYCSIIGGGLELLQSLTGRMPDMYDFFSDIIGSAVGAVAASTLLNILRTPEKK